MRGQDAYMEDHLNLVKKLRELSKTSNTPASEQGD